MSESDSRYENIKSKWKGFWGYIVLSVLLFLSQYVFLSIQYVFKLIKGSKAPNIPRITNPILFKSATTLAKEIRMQKVKSVEVVKAFIDRIEQVNPVLNAVIEMKTEEALEEARKADLLVINHPNLSQLAEEKPLLGIPITVKEHLSVQGFRCTAGSVLYKNKISIKDSFVVHKLKEKGAIILATTNMAQLGMSFNTNNFMYGKTLNPYDIYRTCGGSSGGEGSIVSAAGSVIGIASDLLGSVRLPAYFSGIFGHCPSPGSLRVTGIEPKEIEGFGDFVRIGPLCRFAEDMRLVLKAITDPSFKVKLDLKPDISSLKIYYIEELGDHMWSGMFPVCNEIKKCLHEAINHLEKKFNVKAEKINFSGHYSSYWLMFSALYSEFEKSNFSVLNLLKKDKEDVNLIMELVKLAIWRGNYHSSLLWGCLFATYCVKPATKVMLQLRQESLDLKRQLQQKLGADGVLLLPTFPLIAPYSGFNNIVIGNSAYTGLCNVLSITSTQCPLGLDENGLPRGIQVASNANNDHLCLTIAEELQIAFGGWVCP